MRALAVSLGLPSELFGVGITRLRDAYAEKIKGIGMYKVKQSTVTNELTGESSAGIYLSFC